MRSAHVEPSTRSPLAFFALALVLSVPFWILGALVPTPEDAPIALPLTALQFVAPFVAALILVARQDGWAAVGRVLAHAVDPRTIRPWTWVIPIVIVMPAIYLAAWVIMSLMGRPLPEPEVAWQAVPVLVAIFLVTGFFEEVGWTGYALGPMQARYGALVAALVIGLVWAAFHLVADLQGGHDLGWIAWHRLGSVMLRVLIVSAVNNTGGSVLAAILLHASDNVAWQLFPNNGSHYDPAFVAPITALAALGITVAWGARTLARRGASATAPAAVRTA